MSAQKAVEIVEVAPRDGFQSIREQLPTAEKIAIIEDLIGAGCLRVEFGSFVSPKAVPQMADMADIAAHFRRREGVRLSALVPNVKGTELALKHGVKEIVYVFSASEAHNQNNVRQSVVQSIAGLSDIVAVIANEAGIRLRVDIATAFDCPFDGTVPLQTVADAINQVAGIAPGSEIALCDTTGRANPIEVGRRFKSMMAAQTGSELTWAFHGHDTFGMGVANALYAYEAGVRVLDAAAAGLGGCPFAPGATGNTATEDLIFAFEQGGISTGIDMGRLLDVADRIAALPQASVGSHLRLVPRQRAVA
jgi:hydroxymethylglutaryl-CoA lyase